MRKLVFVLGAAGAGKTTVAKAVAKRRGAVFLDMDTLLRPAAETIMTLSSLDPSDRDSPLYKARCRDLGYRITMDAALENLQLGTDVLVVGPFTKETDQQQWLEQELERIDASLLDVEVKIVLVTLLDEQLYYKRIEQRGSSLDVWKLENWDAFSSSLARREIRWALPHSSILYYDNSEPLTEERLTAIEDFIYGPVLS